MTYEELTKHFAIDKEKINSFLSFLLQRNNSINLTNITSQPDMILKHIYDSLLISKVYDFNNKNVLDIGSGGGFPGIPLAIMFPGTHIILMEPVHKKARFLGEVIRLLGLKNVEVVIDRAENSKDKEKYDVVISRALADLPIYLELAAHLAKINGHIIALKGSKGDIELKRSSRALNLLSLALVKKQEEILPEIDAKRINLIFLKNNKTNKRYPRPFAQIKRQPL